MFRRTRPDSRVTSKPATHARPIVGRKSVVNILIMVLLPAPFGPRSTKDFPHAHLDRHRLHGDEVPKTPRQLRGANRGGRRLPVEGGGPAKRRHPLPPVRLHRLRFASVLANALNGSVKREAAGSPGAVMRSDSGVGSRLRCGGWDTAGRAGSDPARPASVLTGPYYPSAPLHLRAIPSLG